MIHVLIMEDDPMVAKFNRVYLERVDGFTVLEVIQDIPSGWDFLANHDVDLILLDVYMADKNGLDMLVNLRESGWNVDVIVITAANDHTSITRALHYGAVDYLIKPFDFERFQKALLQYKQRFDLMKADSEVPQEALDAFLLKSERPELRSFDLPKGFTALTFSRIAKQIAKWEKHRFSAGDLAAETGISRVSVNKYLNYLVQVDVLKIEVTYQATGRPLHLYQVKPDRMNSIYSLMATED
ncbi:response regulator of citrate/malate metabolism [Virgibacillus natechei]|uniref:Response regulator of citrate/malate metabolism n=1 Tax=Virgibacillus natechei TaxID=1216297 RepID=A0ABS4IJK3_9BACI|nr:response regulator [Virgibacillus natechei]MBP1971101.1 response regulator of citrate/malate metabolism [Virgibacillus natechei]UZD12212.1 response regulator [Virgibacillus natechei]